LIVGMKMWKCFHIGGPMSTRIFERSGNMKSLRQRVQQGAALLGCFLNLGSSLTAEIIDMAGFDWVLIDVEHGAGSERDVLPQLQALEHTCGAGVVRVESTARQRAHRVLDLGAHGIMFPRVNTAEEARSAVAARTANPHIRAAKPLLVRAMLVRVHVAAATSSVVNFPGA
jgi:4-hydroxy-2-oxoheptanedioate aldolase